MCLSESLVPTDSSKVPLWQAMKKQFLPESICHLNNFSWKSGEAAGRSTYLLSERKGGIDRESGRKGQIVAVSGTPGQDCSAAFQLAVHECSLHFSGVSPRSLSPQVTTCHLPHFPRLSLAPLPFQDYFFLYIYISSSLYVFSFSCVSTHKDLTLEGSAH